MIAKPFTKLFLIGLILLLGIQLTGVSCLDEWDSLPFHSSPTLSNQLQTGSLGIDQVGDNGCPCHLTFTSVPKVAAEGCDPLSLLNVTALVALVSGHTFLPFHPPLLL